MFRIREFVGFQPLLVFFEPRFCGAVGLAAVHGLRIFQLFDDLFSVTCPPTNACNQRGQLRRLVEPPPLSRALANFVK